jgi:hypothetical protein
MGIGSSSTLLYLLSFDNTNNRAPEFIPELMADGIHPVHQAFRKRFIHDNDPRRGLRIAVRDITAIDHRHAHDVEEVGAYIVRANRCFGISVRHAINYGGIVIAPA